MASDLFSSPIFEILAGSEQKSILAHAGILSKSNTLKALVEGSWKDSIERQIKLEDWDSDTVVRLVEWLYSGNYSSPCPEKASSSGVIATVSEQTPAEIHDADQVPIDTKSSLYNRVLFGNNRNSSANPFFFPSDRNPADPFSLSSIGDSSANKHFASKADRKPLQCESGTAKSPLDLEGWLKGCNLPSNMMNFEPPLLIHAKVYCLANYMMLPVLGHLAFEHVKMLLSHAHPITAASPAVTNIVELVKYVYANTCAPREGQEPLREALCNLVMDNAAAFRDKAGTEVIRLMMEGGEFTADLWGKVQAKLGASSKWGAISDSEAELLKAQMEADLRYESTISGLAKSPQESRKRNRY